ncbi:clostripain-related cysteine peptidase [Crassaminicella indica]|uniref:Clostripain n=1 Tax=Crassaminicella indica TaxID=2855394 RepID=A0ABX8RBQ4_9CLOT|nr:clostripain-related cysteine peptidase [Crassaminicella indica]QXM06241.1 clostripain [Crassaminicella indica]
MIKNKKNNAILTVVLLICLVLGNLNFAYAKELLVEKKPITIMYYCDADNDLEPDLLSDVVEMKKGVTKEINLIALVDRHESYSSDQEVFGEDFDDTRLYKINPNEVKRLDGGKQFPKISTIFTTFEANMGDAYTLKNFIDYCKEKYPADKYVLILSNHGGGPRKDPKNEKRKMVCTDETNGYDALYTGEISDVLTKEQSVDVLGLDACYMGNVEFAYQFYKGNGGFEADIMVGCATAEWEQGWKYDKILNRLQTKDGHNNEKDSTLGGYEKYYSPKTITNAQIGAIIVEEQRDSCKNIVTNQTLSCYDLSKVKDVKNAVDGLVVAIEDEKQKIEELRGNISNPKIMHYFYSNNIISQLFYPLFDLYDFAKEIKYSDKFTKTVADEVYNEKQPNTVMNEVYIEKQQTAVYDVIYNQNEDILITNLSNIYSKSQTLMDRVDDMILYSYGGEDYDGFKDGKNGLSIFFPSGDSEVYSNRVYHRHFESQFWYSPLDLTKYLALGDMCYGKLKWCKEGINKEINKVGNWFELLDKWYDKDNGPEGGYNEYRW